MGSSIEISTSTRRRLKSLLDTSGYVCAKNTFMDNAFRPRRDYYSGLMLG
ncbi:uncharacterized protein PHALS_01207 [Plasmopara halstedii]|uniref:Uncharacterized protein n=1 Tax=Plasmopara halstedii TaxID=4781 RepID=A0A0P1AUX4_PLAHL|nr:uncharacterized protein PHALS_01207 [Plasmopara halstedii]CEG44877.1 hypothetical protein PHALS_01207 [Plasmopara halstedii]|eukprot:XP_024581246.1 hypothetical protein PHALS_01207 [Plasmopara halstedii]